MASRAQGSGRNGQLEDLVLEKGRRTELASTGFVGSEPTPEVRGPRPSPAAHDLPVKLVGIGESLDDLQPFDADTFVESLFVA